MSSALLAVLFAILGIGLAVTSTACFVLWRRVRALTSPTLAEPALRPEIVVHPPEVRKLGRVRCADQALGSMPSADPGFVLWDSSIERTVRTADPTDQDTVPITPEEMIRRLDELASRQKALEARLAKVEASTTEPGISKTNRRVDVGQPATSEGPTLISVPNLASPPSTTSEAVAELDRRFGPIWGMADEGLSTESIARETGYPIGQVELILGLRRQVLVAENGTDG